MINLFGWGIILYLTRGYYHPTYIYFLIPLLVFAWFRLKFSNSFYYLMISVFCFLNGYHLLVIYPKNEMILLSVKWIFLILSLVFFVMTLISNKYQRTIDRLSFVGLSALILCVFSIPLISPEPYIDVWYHTELALYRMFAFGDNPYSYANYPQLYKEYHSTFVYPPVCLYILTPFRLMSIDIRFGMATLVSASSLFFYFAADRSIGKAKRLIMPLVFLSFPATYFILEQSWMDPISVFFLSLALLLKSKQKQRLFEIALGFFVASKHYNILCLPILLFWVSSDWRERIRAAIRIGLVAAATFVPFLIWDYKALVERMLPGTPHRNNLFYCLNSWIGQLGMDLPNSFALIWILISSLVISWLWRKKQPEPVALFGLLSAVMVTFFTLYSNTAINYHWFSLIGFWFVCHYETTQA